MLFIYKVMHFLLKEKIMNPNVFREYDVRGIVDKDLNEEFIVNLGRSIGTYALQHQVQTMTVSTIVV